MTPAQLTLLDFIRDTIAATGTAPSYEEMMIHLGRKSRGSVHTMVGRLIRDGLLVKDGGRPRGLSLPGVDLASVPTEQLRAELARREKDDG